MLTDKQVAALKYLASASKDGNPTVKRIFYFLLDHSEGLTKEVCITLTQDKEGYGRDEIQLDALALRGLVSCNCATHLDQIMLAAGTDFRFDVHYGHFGEDGKFDTSGMFPGAPKSMVSDEKLTIRGAPLRYTYWLAGGHYSKSATVIPVTRAELEAIDISKPGLYPGLENQLLTG